MYVGIDQSYSGFGLTVIDADGSHYSVLGKFDLAKYPNSIDRLLAIENWLYDNLPDGPWPIKRVCMEGYALGAKFGREQAGELGYAVKRLLWSDRGIQPIIVRPTAVKKFCTGSGAAKKNEILLNVYKRWGVEFKDDNLADSYVLAKIAQSLDEADPSLPKFQQEVLATLS